MHNVGMVRVAINFSAQNRDQGDVDVVEAEAEIRRIRWCYSGGQ